MGSAGANGHSKPTASRRAGNGSSYPAQPDSANDIGPADPKGWRRWVVQGRRENDHRLRDGVASWRDARIRPRTLLQATLAKLTAMVPLRGTWILVALRRIKQLRARPELCPPSLLPTQISAQQHSSHCLRLSIRLAGLVSLQPSFHLRCPIGVASFPRQGHRLLHLARRVGELAHTGVCLSQA